jgi:two-component system response regulator GlrR
MRKRTLLLVEDEPDVLAYLADEIRSFGYDVIEAPDAESSLQIFQGEAVDLVITDMNLPGMNGIELLGEVKRAAPAVPVIMLTGHCSVESFIQTKSRGVFEYVSKPVRREELRRIIGSALAKPPAGTGSVPLDA